MKDNMDQALDNMINSMFGEDDTAEQPEDLGEKLVRLFELKKSKAEIDDESKAIGKTIADLEWEILGAMEETGIESASCSVGSVTVKQKLYPNILDISELLNWCVANDRPDMIQKRVSSGSFQEYFEETGEYPDGTDSYTKATLNARRKRGSAL